MKETRSQNIEQLFAFLAGSNSCLEVVVLQPENNEPVEPEARHAQAVKSAFSVFEARHRWLRVTSDYSRMRSEQITALAFVDARFDIEKRRLAWGGYGTDSWPGYFWAGDARIKRNRILPEPSFAGLAAAFWLSLGHSPCLSHAQAEQGFLALVDTLFDGFSHTLDIRQWSTDWSSFFDEGERWEAAFLWSVYNPQSGQFVVIAASVQDDH